MTRKTLIRLLILISIFTSAISYIYASSLSIDTDYRLRGISYQDTDFNSASSSGSYGYYSQRVQLTIAGSFPGVQIITKLTGIGVVGSTSTPFATPYPNTTMTPFVENAYVVMNNINDLPIDVLAGKQPLKYGDGLIVDDNGVGFNALRIIGHVKPLKLDVELMTAKLTGGFTPNADTDLYGAIGTFEWRKQHCEFEYFRYVNDSGYVYAPPGQTPDITQQVTKNFYDFRLGKRDDLSLYQLEIAKQSGDIIESNNANINLDGFSYTVRGELYGKHTKLGDVTARAFLAINSGNDPANTTSDTSFSPDLTRQYDGLERAGYGILFAATPMSSYFTLPAEYSGVDTLSLGAVFSPLYGWSFSVDYFLYSASVGPNGAPDASGFEKLFGGLFTLGEEMDLSAKYVINKYVTTSLTYARYTPPAFAQFWPTSDPATFYQFEISSKF
ncbi:MAG: hypothetical protein ABSH12_05085 [Endomicrobiales bacterium]|jgi:hypothetical protein